MNKNLSKFLLVAFFGTVSSSVFAQSSTAGGNDVFTYSLLAVGLIIIFWVIAKVADNLLVIEARESGADRSGANFSLLPRLGEIFRPKLPRHADAARTTVLKDGFNINLAGKPSDAITEKRVNTYALMPNNFRGLSPIPAVEPEVDSNVKAGDVMFYDKKNPRVKHVAPVSGQFIELNRGAKRAIAQLVILADSDQEYRQFDVPDSHDASREELIEFMLGSGAWTLIRQRPYNVIPGPDDLPDDIFISTFDTAPLAPNTNLAVQGNEHHFQKGLDVLNRLTYGKVFLGLSGNVGQEPHHAFTAAHGVEHHYFHGKHPAGNVGVHIHHLAPVIGDRKVWTLGVQEVITLGRLFNDGIWKPERLVALSGAEVANPRHIRTMTGASLDDLTKGELTNDHVRVVSGDPLSGTAVTEKSYLSYYDDQVSVLKEGDDYELFGWLVPSFNTPSVSYTFPARIFNPEVEATTNTHGERRAFVVTGEYEQVLPMDIHLQALMKSIMIKDFEKMEGLGIHELVEEDVALPEFACTSKQPLQAILAEGLEMMREQG